MVPPFCAGMCGLKQEPLRQLTVVSPQETSIRETTMAHHLEGDTRFMDQYSRQIGAFGIETMAKLVKLNVLIVGLKGVGIEAAKNLILAGPGSVTLYDDGLVEMKDLGTNFFLTETDVGKRRAACCGSKLADLNKMVTVRVHHGDLTEDVVKHHQVALFMNTPRKELIRWNEFCRSQSPPIGFILCDIRGAMGYAFTDFGKHFVTRDASGENPITRIITNISNDEEGVITLLGSDEDGKMHEMPDSDHDGWIEISEVEGMEDKTRPGKTINDAAPFRIQYTTKSTSRVKSDGTTVKVDVFDPYRLKIGDTRSFTPYRSGGMFTQYKKPYTTDFRSLKDCLLQPIHPGEYGLMFTDGAKFGRAEQLHMALHGLMEFEEKHGHLPEAHNVSDANEVLQYAKKGPISLVDKKESQEETNNENLMFQVEELDENVVQLTSLYAEIELQPLAAFFGGVVAQEIVKFTGKFTPLKQWLHFDAFEVLPEKKTQQQPLKPKQLGTRYDHILNMYGEEFLHTLGSMKTFLVGCGALGCEYLKNFALIGLGCGDNGLITVTDNDRIEVSNLNRQFLFREHNVGHSKSVAACKAAKVMNPAIQVNALEHLVAPNTEHIFHDKFWEELNVVTNALDNVKARLYVDSRCVFFSKPLLESGTLGTKCNVQVILPHHTASYADGPKDAEDDTIPMCTLRNFPSLIEHCIEWSRAQFEDIFVIPAADANKFLENPEMYLEDIRNATLNHPNPKLGASSISKELGRLKQLRETLRLSEKITFDLCLKKAFELFHECFRDRILQLRHSFPEDHVTDSGEKFWTGSKRFPQYVEYEVTNELHETFIKSAANIFAVCYGLNPPPEEALVAIDSPMRDWRYIAQHVSTLPITQWKPSNEIIAVDDSQLKKIEDERQANANSDTNSDQLKVEREELEKLLQELKDMNTLNMKLQPCDFEKDQDLNFHIDFIYASSNLRAWNYRIRPATRHQCKMIAGKIIPAIATATASVTGMAMLEMLKLIQKKGIASFKDSSNSLGLNLYLMQEPAPPEKAKDEYDVIELTEVKCRPSGFTKWDKTVIDSGDLTLNQFLRVFKESTGLNCNLLFHQIAEIGGDDPKFQSVSGLMLYDKSTYSSTLRNLYEQKSHVKLIDWIQERYQGLVDCENQKFVQLETSCTDDQDVPYKVPSVVYRYRKYVDHRNTH